MSCIGRARVPNVTQNIAAHRVLVRSLAVLVAMPTLFAVFASNACASVVTGKVWAWGLDNQGSLGDGLWSGETGTPVEVQGINEIYAVAGSTDGEGGYALRNDGTVWAWGYGGAGQLGDGSPSGSDVPVQVSGLSGAVAIAGGSADGYALLSDGTVEAWGEDQEGQLGIGHAGPYSDVPVAVAGLSGVTSIASGYGTVYALKSDGTVWAWGSNRKGVLGTGSASAYSTTPVQISGLHEVVAVGGSPSFDGYAVEKDGTVWAWGDNLSGALGNGTAGSPEYSDTPVEVSSITNAIAVQGTSGAAYALLSNGHVDSWGDNSGGQLGIGDDGACCNSYIPVEVHSLAEVTAIAAGNDNGYALTKDGTVWSWGDSGYGLLGDGTIGGPISDSPVPVSGLTDVIDIAATSHGSFAVTGFVSSTPPSLPPPVGSSIGGGNGSGGGDASPPPINPCVPSHGSLIHELLASVKCTAHELKLEVECGVAITSLLYLPLKSLKLIETAKRATVIATLPAKLRPVAQFAYDLSHAHFLKHAPPGFRNGKQAYDTISNLKHGYELIEKLPDIAKAISKHDLNQIALDLDAVLGLKSCVQAVADGLAG
jgi:alpha-tubulin suppressor-like RCC1 family protein